MHLVSLQETKNIYTYIILIARLGVKKRRNVTWHVFYDLAQWRRIVVGI
jgi:hypothetical protein